MKITFILLLVTSFMCFGESKQNKADRNDENKKEDHSGYDHEKKKEDHSGHDHEEKKEDHSGHDHGKKKEEHSGHDHDKKNEEHSDHEEIEEDHSAHAHEKKDENHSEHDHGGGKSIGKNKAITDVDEKKGFKLSKEALKTLKIKLLNVDSSTFKIKKNTLVASKNLKGVYRYRHGYFKLLKAEIKKEIKDEYLVNVVGVEFGDQIVINGVGLLRVADIYSTDKSEYGHSH